MTEAQAETNEAAGEARTQTLTYLDENEAKIDAHLKRIAKLEAENALLIAQKLEYNDRYQRAHSDSMTLATDLTKIRKDYEMEKQSTVLLKNQVQELQEETKEYAELIQKWKDQFASFSSEDNFQSEFKEEVDRIRQEYESSRDRLKEQFDEKVNEFHDKWVMAQEKTVAQEKEIAELKMHRDQMWETQEEHEARIDELQQELDVARQQMAKESGRAGEEPKKADDKNSKNKETEI